MEQARSICLRLTEEDLANGFNVIETESAVLLLRYGKEIGKFSKRARPIDSEEIKERTRLLLSPRESEILQYIAGGYANKEISHALGICNLTVRNHVTHIMEKLEAKNRPHAVATALRCGLIK